MFLDEQHDRAEEAIGIARISDDSQEEGYSKGAQKERIKEYCIRRGLKLVKIFEFTESSTIGDRDEFMKAIKYAKKQKGITAVVTDKVDRLQRSYKEVPLLEELIKKQKIELHFHVENLCIHKHSTSQEHMIWNMHVMMAKNYVDSLKDNVNRSIGQKLRMGEWVSSAPIGYKHIKSNPKERIRGDIIIDEERAHIVKRLFEEYSTGAYTLSDMTRKAKEWGLKSPRSNKNFLSKSQIHTTIQNPFYYGEMLYKKRNQLFPHRYPPLISKELWNACQDVRKGWNKKPFKYGGKEYMFRGIVTCATTGRVATSDTKKKKYASGEVAEWTYLRVHRPENPEKKMWVREEVVEKQVADIFRKLKVSPEDLAVIVGHIKSGAKAERSYHEKRLEELHKEHVSIRERMSKLTDLLLDGDISKEIHDEKRTEMAAKRDEIVYEMEQYNKADDTFTNSLIGMVEVASGAYDTFIGGTIEQKKRLMNFVLSNLRLEGATLCYDLKKPFDSFVNVPNTEKWLLGPDSNQRPSD